MSSPLCPLKSTVHLVIEDVVFCWWKTHYQVIDALHERPFHVGWGFCVSEVGKEGWTQMETQKGDTEGDTTGRVTKGGNSL